MLNKNTELFFQFPSETANRILHPVEIVEIAEGTITARFVEPELAPEPGQDALVYFEVRREFMQQSINVTALMEDEPSTVFAFQTNGDPVSAESRECYHRLIAEWESLGRPLLDPIETAPAGRRRGGVGPHSIEGPRVSASRQGTGQHARGAQGQAAPRQDRAPSQPCARPPARAAPYACAGQAPMFFHHAASSVTERWSADEPPLGVISGMEFGASRRIDFEAGDALILTTDGFFEWSDPSGEQFGMDRLEAFVNANARLAPGEFIRDLHAAVLALADGESQPDDLTVVVVQRVAPGASID